MFAESERDMQKKREYASMIEEGKEKKMTEGEGDGARGGEDKGERE